MPHAGPKRIRHRQRNYVLHGTIEVRRREYFLLRLLSRKAVCQGSSDSSVISERWLALDARRGPLDELCTLHVMPRNELTGKRLRVLQHLARTTPFVPQIRDHDFRDAEVRVVTDWVPGKTLETYLAERNHRRRSFSPLQAFRLYRGLVQALCGLHRTTGLVHGDVHPENIVLRSGSNWLVLIDFGSAWRTLESVGRDEGDGMRAVWSAPELIDQESANVFADQFSASVLLYQMLTGEIPYDRLGGSAARIPIEQRSDLWQPPSSIASSVRTLARASRRQVDSFLVKSLNLNAAERFESDSQWFTATKAICERLEDPNSLHEGSAVDRLISLWTGK